VTVPRTLLVPVLLAVAALAAACGVRETTPPAASPPAEGTPDRGPRATIVELPANGVGRAQDAGVGPPRALAVERACQVERPLRSTVRAFAGVVRRRTTAYSRPGGGRALASFGLLNANRVPTVFGVLGSRRCAGTWYRVQLPIRPNGAVGWVRAADVDLVAVRTSILVDLSQRTLTLSDRGRTVLTAPVAIGAPPTPTPTGAYYVNQRLVAPDPSGPYGPAAVGISGFSPTLTGWTQGGPLAIHGTNRPDLIGQAVSHGCVRVRNDVLRQLYVRAEPGTPVVISA